MNIFVLDADPALAAADQCDKHVVKMILESAQLLSTVGHLHGAPGPYKPTHAQHPCTRWVAESAENYRWLLAHLHGLLAEYTRRYGKVHAVEAKGVAARLAAHAPALPERGLTPFAQVMPEAYRVPCDAVAAYRAFYVAEKSPIACWRHGEPPRWFVEGLQARQRTRPDA